MLQRLAPSEVLEEMGPGGSTAMLREREKATSLLSATRSF